MGKAIEGLEGETESFELNLLRDRMSGELGEGACVGVMKPGVQELLSSG